MGKEKAYFLTFFQNLNKRLEPGQLPGLLLGRYLIRLLLFLTSLSSFSNLYSHGFGLVLKSK